MSDDYIDEILELFDRFPPRALTPLEVERHRREEQRATARIIAEFNKTVREETSRIEMLQIEANYKRRSEALAETMEQMTMRAKHRAACSLERARERTKERQQRQAKAAAATAAALVTAEQAARPPPMVVAEPVPEALKCCLKCNTEKPLSSFGKRLMRIHTVCKLCVNTEQQTALNASQQARDSKKIAQQKWAMNNKDKIKEKGQRYKPIAARRQTERRLTDENFRISGNLRTRINSALLKGVSRSESTFKLIGCDLEYLRAWIESRFHDGMTWENYGKLWEFDHVRPCCSYDDLADPVQQTTCFSWKNMQPLLGTINRSKNGTVPSQAELDTHDQLVAAWFALHPNTFSNHGKNLKD